MSGLVRTQYWNVGGPNPTPRTGNTARAESRTDVEGYLLAADAARTAALHDWGVAAGLQVSATAGATGLRVAVGAAIDVTGRLLVLAAGGRAIVDPLVGPGGEQNIPTVEVAADGVELDTAGLAGDRLLTVAWREVEETTEGLLVLRQAPWLRLIDPDDFAEDGLQLVLAGVTLADGGPIAALRPGARRLVAATAGRLELRATHTGAAPNPTVGQRPGAELRLTVDGALAVRLLPPGAAPAALLTAGPTGDTLALLPDGGAVGIGLRGTPPLRPLHVEGGVHTGGPQAAFSFADRAGLAPWSWHATDGAARLTCGGDQLTVTAGGRVGVGTTAPTHPVHIAASAGLRQNRLHLTGDTGWSSLAYNAHHDPANQGWTFPDPSRPAVTLEMDDHAGTPRFAVYTTTAADTSGWQLRLHLDGDTGRLHIPADLSTGAGATFHGVVSVRTSAPNPRLVGSLNVTAESGAGVCAISRSGAGVSASGSNGPGVWATGAPAAQFVGDVAVSGTLTAGAKQFLIDHPLDPERRTLAHAGVESDQWLVVYSGAAHCDEQGGCVVTLPAWLPALATDFRYQLTCVGEHAPVYIAEPVRDNRFTIAGGTAGLTVSWQLTGVRHDPWARDHALAVEQDKPAAERGFYHHPHAYGRDMTASVHWARNEQLTRAHPLLARELARQHTERRSDRPTTA